MLFGTSGIRGLYGTEITPLLAMKIANAFAQKEREIALATDMRETSEILKNVVISSALATGVNVMDLGEIPTPTLAFYTQKKNCKGIMITASHNPGEYNGLKLYRNGREISKKEEAEVEADYGKEMRLVKWDKLGKLFHYEYAVREHIEMIKRNVNMEKIRNAKIKVVVDCNGVGMHITPALLREMGCIVISMNCGKRGFYRNPEPTAENLAELGKMVRASSAHIGIAHDGDADRVIFTDENGEMLGLDVQFGIITEHELKQKNGLIISTIEASLLIKELIKKNKGKNIVVGVGSTNVSEAMEKNKNAIFGGEPAGEYIFKNGVNTPDGILGCAKFLEIFAENGSFAQLKKNYKIYPIIRKKFGCTDRKRAMEKISKAFLFGGNRNVIDGIREDFEDGFMLVRASGTENAIRLTAEFRSMDKLMELAEKAEKIIKDAIKK